MIEAEAILLALVILAPTMWLSYRNQRDLNRKLIDAEMTCDALRADVIEKREELTYVTQRYIDENQRCVGALKLLTAEPWDNMDAVDDAVALLRGDDEDEPDALPCSQCHESSPCIRDDCPHLDGMVQL